MGSPPLVKFFFRLISRVSRENPMNPLIDRLHELLKSYTVAASVANATKAPADADRAQALLDSINKIRIDLAVNAEMREVFWQQKNIPAAANANIVQNIFVSKNDINYTFTRGIASLLVATNLRLLNQGARAIEITRNATAWQMLFSDIQKAVPLGQQIPFNFPETLFFGENQSLNIGIQGQTSAGFMFFHGATLKDNLLESSIADIRREFLTDDGNTRYIPETQIVPIEFKFADANAGTIATDGNGDDQIFTVKNDKSVLLTEVSTTTPAMRVTLTDEGKNLTFCDTVEVAGIAATATNPFTGWYPLPEPHLLRRGDRIKLKGINGSLITGDETAANTLNYLAFRGHTL